MRRWLAALLTVAMVPTLAAAQTSEEDWKVCPKIENEDAAIEACTRIIERKGEGRERTGIAYSNRCGAHGRLGQDDEGLSDCNNAIRLLPNYSMAYNNRGNRWRAKKDLDKALADYNKAIQLDPKNAFAHNNRGLIYDDRKQFDLALTDYSRAIELDPTYFTAYLNRGDLLRNRGDYDRAGADYQKATLIDPSSPNAHESLGSAMSMLGRYELGLKHSSIAIDLDPTTRHAYFARGFTHLMLADFAKAANDLRKAADLNVLDQAMIYLYVARARGGDPSTDELSRDLEKLKPNQWPRPVGEMFLGSRSPEDMRRAATTASERCEAAFAMAQLHLIRNEREPAIAAFQSAFATCPTTDYERMGAREELRRLGG